MNYTTLLAPKGTSGSIANWVGYAKLDLVTILEEAQSLLYQALRVREMRTQFVFGLAVGQSEVALPARFLDPTGRLYETTNSLRFKHRLESEIVEARSFEPLSGTFGNNPFTTGAVGSQTVTCAMAAHGLNQGSDITFPTTAPTVDGINLAGTFRVSSVIDANSFVITTMSDTATAGNVNGGGAGITWTANNLIASTPGAWSIWDEAIKFDCATDTAYQFRLNCYRSLPLLSAANQTNFLTNRYPLLLRKATQAAAADQMKDDTEYAKATKALAELIGATNAESDLIYRGAEIETETP